MFHVKQPQDPALALGIPPSAKERLRDHVELLMRWNRRINLVAERDASAIWQRHVIDSLQLVPLIRGVPDLIVDIGSGAGFPGLILAVATGRPTHLVESDKRKAAFLLEATRQLGLSQIVQVHPVRIEHAELPPTPLLTARALAPLGTLLGHACRMLRPDGIALFPKGRSAEDELTDACRDWTMQIERCPSLTDPAATILRLSEIRPAGVHA